MPFGDCNVIEHIIHRTKHYHLEPIICTSIDRSDDILEEISKKKNIKIFRGSLINKLKRWYDCCNYFDINKFHTVDADDPFFDGKLIKKSMILLEKGYDVVCPTESSSAGDASVGYSLTRDVIKRSLENIDENEDTEMMWYYLDKIPNLKKMVLPNVNSHSFKARLTLDYEEDYWLLESVRRILGNLTSRDKVDHLFLSNPDMYKINWFRNKEWKAGQKEKQNKDIMKDYGWRFKGNERKYIEEVLASGFRAGSDGAFSTRLEKKFTKMYNVNYGIAFNSGTSTLHASLLALGCGPNDEVLTPALTPLMCGLAPYYTGANPVYVDSLPDTFLMDPDDIENKITEKTKVIFVTHMYGGVCDMEKITLIAKNYGLHILEDCAQCHMGKNKDGKLAGTIGEVGSWSFENSKQLTCGDGGIVTCNEENLAEKNKKNRRIRF